MHIQSLKSPIMVSKHLISSHTKYLSYYFLFLDVKCPSCNNIFVIEIQQSSKWTKSPPKPSKLLAGINIEKKVEATGVEGTSGMNKTSHSFSSIGKYNIL